MYMDKNDTGFGRSDFSFSRPEQNTIFRFLKDLAQNAVEIATIYGSRWRPFEAPVKTYGSEWHADATALPAHRFGGHYSR